MINDDNKDDGLFSGVVFAVFNNQKDIDVYKRNFPKSFFAKVFRFLSYFFKKYICCPSTDEKEQLNLSKHNLLIEDAPEPDDIIWENLQYTTAHKLLFAILIYLISAIFIAFSFAVIVGLSYVQFLYRDHDSIKTALSVTVSIVINIMNGLITVTLNKLSE
jgi:hypothetical protein